MSLSRELCLKELLSSALVSLVSFGLNLIVAEVVVPALHLCDSESWEDGKYSSVLASERLSVA